MTGRYIHDIFASLSTGSRFRSVLGSGQTGHRGFKCDGAIARGVVFAIAPISQITLLPKDEGWLSQRPKVRDQSVTFFEEEVARVPHPPVHQRRG